MNKPKFVSKETYNPPIYVDAAATTPTDPRVAELVLRIMTEEYGNSGSRTHVYGAAALATVSRARDQLARTIAANPDEIIFTAGATESDNLAILGLAEHGKGFNKRHIITSSIEHKAVLEPIQHLASHGFDVTIVQPDAQGYVSASDILEAVRPDTLLVSIMHANNETGAIQPIEALCDGLAQNDGLYFHVDAAQTYGKENTALSHRRIDLMSISGHKLLGPKGIGALVARRRGNHRIPLTPLMYGGGQERGLRPGTLATPLIAGLGLACELASRESVERKSACEALRNQAIEAFAPLEPVIHGDPKRGVLPHILSLAVPGIDSEAVMVAAKDLVSISNGSACTSARYEPSHVLQAMGLAKDVVDGTVRLSWTHLTPSIPWNDVVARIDDLRF